MVNSRSGDGLCRCQRDGEAAGIPLRGSRPSREGKRLLGDEEKRRETGQALRCLSAKKENIFHECFAVAKT